MGGMRVDKWIWCVRLAKTRTVATGLCHTNKVEVNGSPARSSRAVRPGDEVTVRRAAFVFCYRVLDLPGARLPAREVPSFMLEVTPEEVLEAARRHRQIMRGLGDAGAGRPTKRDRRQLDDFLDW